MNNTMVESKNVIPRVFNNDELGSVRVVEMDGEPWFVSADVCRILGIGNSRDAARRLDEDEKGVVLIDTLGGCQQMSIVNEPGLYSLILGSRKLEAKAFKRWVTHEVIPSIRKHGAYMTEDVVDMAMSDPEAFLRLVEALRDEKAKAKALQSENEELLVVNEALMEEKTVWDDPAIINALVRRYAFVCCDNIFGVAWNKFYKELNYKCGYNLKHRQTAWRNNHPDEKDIACYKFLKPDEVSSAISVLVALCEADGVKTADILLKYKPAC